MHARFEFLKLEDLFNPEDGLLKRHLQIVPQVGTGPGSAPPAPTTAAKSKKFLEQAAKIRKDVVKSLKSLKSSVTEAVVTVAIIETPLFRILQHLVGFRGFFEFFFRFEIV